MKDSASAFHFQTPIKKEKIISALLISALYSKNIYVPTVPYFTRNSGWIGIPVALGVTPSMKKKHYIVMTDESILCSCHTHTRTLFEYIYEKNLWILQRYCLIRRAVILLKQMDRSRPAKVAPVFKFLNVLPS
jgi:hypothetical protein